MNSRNKLKIVVLYESVLGVYGDHGNSVVLAKRAQLRGIDAETVFVNFSDPIPADGNVYLLGGGEDTAQISATKALLADRGLFQALNNGAALLAICAGYQICGKTYTVGAQDTQIEGLGLLDVVTTRGPQRAVGETLSCWTCPDGSQYLLTGFENHAGFTTLGTQASPLAKVEVGVGNGDGTEGAVAGKVIGLYPHGPALPRNPKLADHLIELALDIELDPLEIPDVEALRADRIAAARRLASTNRRP